MRTNDKVKFLIVMLLTCCISTSHAQQRRVLTIEEMFDLAEANSKSIKAYQIAVAEAIEGVKVAKNDRLPSIEASLSFSYIGDGWMSDRDFSNGQNTDMPHYGNNFSLRATQVVYAGGAINAGIELSQLSRQAAETELLNNRQNIRFLLIGHYLDLFQLNNQAEIYRKNIEQTNLLIDEITASYNQGTALKSDITRYELQLENLKLGLTNTLNRIRILSRQLATTIGLDEDVEIVPDSTIADMSFDKGNEALWQEGKSAAPSLALANLNVAMSRKQQDMAKAERRPTIGLFAADSFDGPILIEVPAINKNFNYWYVGVSVSYNFDSLFKSNKKLKKAKLATLRAEEEYRLADEQISNDIHEAYILLDEAYVRHSTKLKNVQLAHENYNVVHSRYINGLALVTDMLDASNIQLSSELELSNAQIGIIYQYYLLKKTVGSL